METDFLTTSNSICVSPFPILYMINKNLKILIYFVHRKSCNRRNCQWRQFCKYYFDYPVKLCLRKSWPSCRTNYRLLCSELYTVFLMSLCAMQWYVVYIICIISENSLWFLHSELDKDFWSWGFAGYVSHFF